MPQSFRNTYRFQSCDVVRFNRVLIAAIVVCSSILSDFGHGQTSWTNTTPGGSNWGFGGNWSAGAPSVATDAIVSNGGTASATGPAFLPRTRNLSVGGNSTVQVFTTAPNLTQMVSQGDVTIGTTSQGRVIVRDAGTTWQVAQGVFVGSQSFGELNIENGATTSSMNGFLGELSSGLGAVNVVGPGSTWSVADLLRVGNQGTGSLYVAAGGHVSSFSASIGVSNAVSGKFGVAQVDGDDSRWDISDNLFVGEAGSGSLVIVSGGRVASSAGRIGSTGTAEGTVTVIGELDGTYSSWMVNGPLYIGESGKGDLDIAQWGHVSSLFSPIGFNSGATGKVFVHGEGATWNTSSISLGAFGSAELRIEDGGRVTSSAMSIGDGANPAASVFVSGDESTLEVEGLIVGESSTGVLAVEDSAAVSISGNLEINNWGTLRLVGGTVVADSLLMTDSIANSFDFVHGRVCIVSDQVVAGTSGIGRALGANASITPGQTLEFAGRATLQMPLTLDGGTISAGQLVNAPLLTLKRGTLNLTNQAVVVEPGGLFGDRLELTPGMTINVASGVTNHGLITGNGTLGGALLNAAGGEIRAQAGHTLTLAQDPQSASINSGDLRLLNGFVEFGGTLVNSATGRITGRGTFETGGGLANHGHIALSSGITDVFGDVENDTGNESVGVTISGNADVTFWDDVHNIAGSLFRVSAGSSATFFGTVADEEGISGPGSLYFEADVSPGASPAAVSYGGNVSFGPAASLVMELGGVTPGAQHDKLLVAESLSLGGSLDVSIIDGFVPVPGESFDILDWGERIGVFSAVNLPALAGLNWDTSQLYTTGVLSLVVAGQPSDYNGDGTVDAADYTVWRDRLGQAVSLPNETETLGMVTHEDYYAWVANFGNTLGAGSSGTVASRLQAGVPEPSCLLLSCVAVIGAFLGRRRKAKPVSIVTNTSDGCPLNGC